MLYIYSVLLNSFASLLFVNYMYFLSVVVNLTDSFSDSAFYTVLTNYAVLSQFIHRVALGPLVLTLISTFRLPSTLTHRAVVGIVNAPQIIHSY